MSLGWFIPIAVWLLLVVIIVALMRAGRNGTGSGDLSARQIENLRPRGNVDRTPREKP